MLAQLERIVRRNAERWARGRVFRRSISVGGKRVPLWVSPDAQLKYMKLGKGAFDADLIRIAEALVEPESVVWDVGANIGTFSMAAASLAVRGLTVAVEADIWLAALVRRSSQLPGNEGHPLRTVPCAIADHCGVATFDIAARGRANNALRAAGGRSQMGGVRASVDVPCLTLDVLAESFPSPSLIKIDVEGAELMVLRGGQKLLQDQRPVLYVEVGEEVSAEVARLADNLDYALFDPSGAPILRCAPNTFIVPREKVTALRLHERLREVVARH